MTKHSGDASCEQPLERFIGFIYRPDAELISHYTNASLPEQYHAFIWFDETSAVTPLGPETTRPAYPPLYPFGIVDRDKADFNHTPQKSLLSGDHPRSLRPHLTLNLSRLAFRASIQGHWTCTPEGLTMRSLLTSARHAPHLSGVPICSGFRGCASAVEMTARNNDKPSTVA